MRRTFLPITVHEELPAMIFLLFVGSLITITWILRREQRFDAAAGGRPDSPRESLPTTEDLFSLSRALDQRGRGATAAPDRCTASHKIS
jgi:hypothetical protein